VIRVEVTGHAVPRLSRPAISGFAARCIRAVKRGEFELAIAIVNDSEMAALNRKYRRKNRTTDVLTFPGEGAYLGDLAISVDQARRQATAEGHSLATEIRYLILHGVLHAFGHDHENDGGMMNAMELRLRRRVGLE
jgi:probable rRNA maturation factor